jgi:hypothetical protein
MDNAPQKDRPEYVFVERPRCPTCNGTRLLTYRTTRNGDDTLTRHAKCADCGQRVYVVVE